MTHPKVDPTDLLADPLGALARARSNGWLGKAENVGLVALTYERVRELVADGRLATDFLSFLRSFGIGRAEGSGTPKNHGTDALRDP